MRSLTVLRQDSVQWFQRVLGFSHPADRAGAAFPAPDDEEYDESIAATARPYVIEDGKIQTKACELAIVHHCNLTCRACSHLSPVLKAHHMDPAKIERDLSVLARVYQPEHVRLLGGEPLLHPALVEVMQAVRRSGITRRVRVVTNGVLLARQSAAFWREVNEVHVSVYPGKEMTAGQLASCRRAAQDHGVTLKLNYYDRFRESHSELGTEDQTLVRRIYNTCHIAHVWRCHTVDNGVFYKCPQSLLLPRLLDALGGNGGCGDREGTGDGLKIDDARDFQQRLLNYLESPEPLTACSRCMGSVGRWFENEQVARKGWREHQRRTTEELLDDVYLNILEHERPGAPLLCVRGELPDPANRDLARRRGIKAFEPG